MARWAEARELRMGEGDHMLIFEDDPELTMTLALMTKQERIKFLKKAIRDTEDNGSKKVFRYLLSEVKKDS